MNKHRSRTKPWAPHHYCMSACLALLVNHAVAADTDPYLEAIESEVKTLNSEPAAAASRPPPLPGPTLPPFMARPMPPLPPRPPAPEGFQPADMEALSRQQFKDALRSVYPGSYFLLRKLPDAEQQAVLQEYQQTGDLFRVRQMIMELARGQ